MEHERISINPKVMIGKPCIMGTRITVELILKELGTGWSEDQVLEAHPHITVEDIHASQAYASEFLSKHTGELALEAGEQVCVIAGGRELSPGSRRAPSSSVRP
jgi:uncharacterized protein (DUF433 family)